MGYPRGGPLQGQDRPHTEAANPSCIGTASVSAAFSVASPESQADGGPVPPAANVGSASQTGGADLRNQCDLGAACRTSLSCPSDSAVDCKLTQSPRSPPSSYRNCVLRKAAEKSKPKGVTKVDKKPPLPEFPGIGNNPPIRYGKSTVYSSPAGQKWFVKQVKGARITHGVRWGQSRKDQVKNWDNIKAWLRKYN